MNLREEKEAWEALLAHPKWKELCEYAEAQRTHRTVNLINGLDDRREEDRQRGEILGIGLFVQYPISIVEALQVELDNEGKEKEDGHE